MSLTATGSSSTYAPPPAGTHAAVCCQIIDKGTQHNDTFDKDAHKVLVGWELSGVQKDDGTPWLVWQTYTMSLHEKAKLSQHLTSWRGRPFTAQEMNGFKLQALLDVPCMLSIVHETRDNNTYGNIQTIMGLPEGMPAPIRTLPLTLFDIDTWDQMVFDTFSDKLKETILKSPEAQARNAGVATPQLTPEVENQPAIDVPF